MALYAPRTNTSTFFSTNALQKQCTNDGRVGKRAKAVLPPQSGGATPALGEGGPRRSMCRGLCATQPAWMSGYGGGGQLPQPPRGRGMSATLPAWKTWLGVGEQGGNEGYTAATGSARTTGRATGEAAAAAMEKGVNGHAAREAGTVKAGEGKAKRTRKKNGNRPIGDRCNDIGVSARSRCKWPTRGPILRPWSAFG